MMVLSRKALRLIEDASQRQAEGDDPNHYIDRASAVNLMALTSMFPTVFESFAVASIGFQNIVHVLSPCLFLLRVIDIGSKILGSRSRTLHLPCRRSASRRGAPAEAQPAGLALPCLLRKEAPLTSVFVSLGPGGPSAPSARP